MLEAVSSRGTMIGNRGVINGRGKNRFQLTKTAATTAWLCCELVTKRKREVQRNDNRSFNGRKRVVWSEGRWTELFFLDEPTALAAGHRPCACCRNADYKDFMKHWSAAHPGQKWTAGTVDAVLETQRSINMGSRPHLSERDVKSLPSGAFVSWHGEPWLIWEGAAYKWGHNGYSRSLKGHSIVPCILITPPGVLATLRTGWGTRAPHSTVVRLQKDTPSDDLST